MTSHTFASTAASASGAYDATITGTWIWIQKLLMRTGCSVEMPGGMKVGCSSATLSATIPRSPPTTMNHRERNHASHAIAMNTVTARDEDQRFVDVADHRPFGNRRAFGESPCVVAEPDDGREHRDDVEDLVAPREGDDAENDREGVEPRRVREGFAARKRTSRSRSSCR
jgi:hypothetical protein